MENSTVIRMRPNLCVSDIRSSYSTIAESLEGFSSIKLEIPDDVMVDLSFLQVIEAARLKANEQGKSLFSLSRPAANSGVRWTEAVF